MNLSETRINEGKLISLRNEVLGRLELLDKDKKRITNPFPESSDDEASASENDEVVNLLDKHNSAELKKINIALDKIYGGTFGVCSICGAEITKRRLEAVPYAENCIICENDK